MADNHSSNPQPSHQPANRSTSLDAGAVFLFLLMAGGSTFMIVQGALIFQKYNYNDGTLLGLGIVGAIVTAGLYVLCSTLSGSRGAGASQQLDPDEIRSLSASLQLSETAKRIIYRDRDRQALRKAIREDIDKRDYEAALTLVSQMSQVYGYRLEAEQFRSEIEAARAAEQEKKIEESIRAIDNMTARREFDKALIEAGKVERLYAESDRVVNLRAHVREAKDRYKHELERKFLEAAGRDDIEVAMELVKELDLYLTEAEAAPFLETARGVIGKKRQNLGVQFKLAVHDKDWLAAVRVGEQLIREFPNSKMAEEVRGHLDRLRGFAAAQQAVTPLGARELV